MMCLNSFCMRKRVQPYLLKSKTLRTFSYTSQLSGFKAWCGKMSSILLVHLTSTYLACFITAQTPEAHNLGPYSHLSVIKQHPKKYAHDCCLKKPTWLATWNCSTLQSPGPQWAFKSCRKTNTIVPQSPQSSTGWAWWVMFGIVNRYNQNISSLWSGEVTWYGGDLFEHGPVNICGAEEESEECCNRPVLASEV